MIELRTLGRLDLRDATDSRECASVLAGPKRVALLVYLALARPLGFRRRDTLLGAFWPELDDARARGALNQALYVLRQALGPDLVVSRGTDEVGLRPEALWCDAVEFDQALDAGQPARALELYQGGLLDGFHLPDSPEFERWLEVERARLRQRAVAAARRLAVEEAAAGDAAGAARRLQAAAAWRPYDETIARDLIELRRRTGDAGGALREYEAFAERLARDLELGPTPELEALVEEIRAALPPQASAGPHLRARTERASGADLRSAPGASPAQAGDAASPSVREEVSEGQSESPPRRPRRLLTPLLGSAAAVAALAVHIVWLADPAPSAPAVPADTRLVVLPFEIQGSDRFDYLGEGVAELLGSRLDVPGYFRTVDPRQVHLRTAAPSGQRYGAEEIRRAARRLGADAVLLGTLVEAGGSLELTASLYDADARRQEQVEARADREADLFDALDRLTQLLLEARLVKPGQGLARTAIFTTRSIPALKAYLAGSRALRDGRFREAIAGFEEAIAEDSAFALAYFQLARAADWIGDYPLAYQAGQDAWTRRQGLPERARLLVEAAEADHDGRTADAERLLGTAIERYPEEVAARHALADLRFHATGWGILPGEVRPGFERVLEVDPGNTAAVLHLARLAALERDSARLDSLLERLDSASRTGLPGLEVRALRALTAGDVPEQERIAAELRDATASSLVLLLPRLAAFSGRLADVAPLARRLTDPLRSDGARAAGHAMLAALEAGRGRLRAADSEVRALAALDPTLALASRALLATAPHLPAHDGRLAALRDSLPGLLAGGPPAAAPAATEFGGTLGILASPAALRQLTGLSAARLGDSATAGRHAAALDSLGTDHGLSAAAHVRALLAWQDGRAGDALGLIGAHPRRSPPPLSPSPADVILRAQLLGALGREEEALRWYASLIQESPFSPLYLAPAHLGRAELHDRRGEAEEAAVHYGRFVELWSDADPELRPRVRAAERRLAQLARR